MRLHITDSPRRVFLLLACCVAVCYQHTLHFPFQFDDYRGIVDNAKVHSLQGFWADMPGIRALLKLSFTLNGLLDQDASGFRLVNIFIHLVSSFLVWKISTLALEKFHAGASKNRNNHFIALLTALLFACHPAHTEVVTYVSARSTGLMAMFYLLAFYLLISARNNKAHFLIAGLCFAAALAVKETAWTLPLAILLWYGIDGEKIKPKYLVLIGVAFGCALLALFALPKYRELLLFSSTIRSPEAQLMGQINAHFHLLTETLFGLNLNMDPAFLAPEKFSVAIALKGFLPFGLIVIALHQRRQRPWLCWGIAWYFLHLLPTNSIIPRLDLVVVADLKLTHL